MNNIEDIDKLIKETLTAEESKFYQELEAQNLLGMVKSTFTGKLGWLLVIMTVLKLFIFGGIIYCTIQLFHTEVTNELIKWALAIVILSLMISMLKLFAWLQMDKNALLREIKRLELQVSSLSGKISD
ncbi:MAG: DUF6768 family protein [Tenacibaculum sp.]